MKAEHSASRMAGPPALPETRRYSAANQLFHWISALLIVAVIVLGWVMVSGGSNPAVWPLWEWHKTLGLAVLFATAARVVWRRIDPPPPPMSRAASWNHAVAKMTYLLFFAIMLAMPISGYMLSTAGGHAPVLFNVIETPALIGEDPRIAAIGLTVHLAAQWLLYALILLHLAGVVFHVVIVRDRTLDRMLPIARIGSDDDGPDEPPRSAKVE